MAWIKRNLFFVIGGLVALGLLGGAGFYIYQGWTRNSGAADKLNEIYGTLKKFQSQKPSPGNEKIDNTEIAKVQRQQLADWIKSAEKYFQPIPPIPPGNISSEAYAGALRRTIDGLQHEADDAKVALPPKTDKYDYSFSFSAERQLVKFADGSLEPLATQLGEVKAITETVFSARVNALDSIQRVRVSADDATGPAGDYLDELPVTNDLAVITPYIVTFRCFTPELARVVGVFASSSNTFLIRTINVAPASAAAAQVSDASLGVLAPGMAPGMLPPGAPVPGVLSPGVLPPGAYPGAYPGVPAQPAAPPAGKGGLQTVLKEQLLRVSLEVGLVKLRPRS